MMLLLGGTDGARSLSVKSLTTMSTGMGISWLTNKVVLVNVLVKYILAIWEFKRVPEYLVALYKS